MKKKSFVILIVLLVVSAVAIENYAIARTDLDWMIVENHFDMWNAEKDTWEFSPHVTMGWWDAYMLTMWRLIISATVLGFMAAIMVWIITRALREI